ncbi:MAG TPA: molecular chaperone HtpG [Acidobacteria bacterium]|jgi:molecular chaperone HtpG|nr:molecular chaperone HtpG [Acidobacteriota bacterium]MDP6372306.1 molecular chaperone HtpG [Vicinamibacterales bacterium]HAK54784.1 molecular chaperone HtpG [Acidobacteriota bacterium]|tara:strand:- start:4643 stop:6559 length:1917 start_codon:yes stop_codon:yes gene_type:complete
MTGSAETFQFQAETKQLLDIVIHSLYSQKEIFLRELISNASDALDRVRLEGLTDADLLGGDEALEIRLETDPEARTFTISDNGIGMTRAEVAEHIGTIAKSGTRELVERLQSTAGGDAAQLIGQFGVGFYSVFMVADRVTLVTRRAGEENATRWSSTGDGTYELADDNRFSRGTTITLHLKPADPEHGLADFIDPMVFQGLVKRYSDFVGYPIKAAVPAPDAKVDAAPEERVLNSMQPIWTRPAADVTDEEFTEFYRHVARDWGEPLDRLALRAEGRLEYQALLFVPAHAPFDLYFRDQQFGLQLYVRRVLIMDRCQNLLPPYLRFVKGIVDAADLPLNVSREMIQQDRHIGQMQSWLSRKVLNHLKQLLESDREKFRTLWGEFGPVLKEGVAGEGDVRDRLLPLLLFQSSHNPSALTTLDEYVARMKPEQTEIYYLTGESRAVVEHSPHLEAFQSKGYEVLYLVDPVDELVAERVQEFSGKPVKSVGKGTVELGNEDERKQAEADLSEQRKRYGSLLEFLQTTLADDIKEARLSSRLTTSPVCLVGADGDLSPALERMLRRSQGADAVTQQKRILEVNPKHPIAAKLQERFEANQDDSVLVDYAQLLLGYALLAEGSELPDPARFNRAIGDLMVKGL